MGYNAKFSCCGWRKVPVTSCMEPILCRRERRNPVCAEAAAQGQPKTAEKRLELITLPYYHLFFKNRFRLSGTHTNGSTPDVHCGRNIFRVIHRAGK